MAVCGWEFPDKVCCGQHLGHAGDHVRWGGKSSQDTDLETRYRVSWPIIQAAIDALLVFEETVDPIGYDLDYCQEDLPQVVARAIAPWASSNGRSEL
jgi:hypothetical protein